MYLLLLMYLGLASFPLTYCLEFFCPSTSQWFNRAKTACNFADQYYCLYDVNNRNYTEICQETPTFESPGHKVVIVGGIQGIDCEHDIYQSFKYWTNGSSTCAFKKYLCNAEGQVIYDNGTTKTDRQCRCDYSRGYDFIKKPKNSCYCEPSKEDCTCYRKQCPSGSVLSPDYNCINLANWSMKSTCSMIPDYTDKDKQRPVMQIPTRDDEKGTKKSVLRVLLIIITGLFVSTLLTILKGTSLIWQSCDQIPQDILDLQMKRKEELKTYFNDFVETEAFRVILNYIRQEQFVIVSGPAGCGKSSSTFHAALKLEETEKFNVWIIKNPDDFLTYSSAVSNPIFFVDDAFGRYTVHDYYANWWSQHDCSLKNILKGNANLKLVMTCRSYIYRSANTIETLKPFCHVDFFSASLNQTIQERIQERREIGKCYFNTKDMDRVNDDVIMLYNFFPSLCSRFSELNTEDMIEYFTFPINYIAEEVKQFQSLGDPVFLAFAVLIIRGNKVKKDLFNSDKYNRMLNNLSKELDFKEKSSKALSLSTFIAIQDLYVLDKTTWFESLHENLFLMISHCISPHMIGSIILYGESSFIQKRLRCSPSGVNGSKFDILVPEQYKDMLSNRLKNGLQE